MHITFLLSDISYFSVKKMNKAFGFIINYIIFVGYIYLLLISEYLEFKNGRAFRY